MLMVTLLKPHSLCDVSYITRLLSQYNDAGRFYYNTHKTIINQVCGGDRFYRHHYLEGYSILNFSTSNYIVLYKHIYILHCYFLIIHNGLAVTFHYVPPLFLYLLPLIMKYEYMNKTRHVQYVVIYLHGHVHVHVYILFEHNRIQSRIFVTKISPNTCLLVFT